MPQPFIGFPKMGRLYREIIVTEKIDGTNSSIFITHVDAEEYPDDITILGRVDNLYIRAGSRNKWITPGKSSDNAGFARWVVDNLQELSKLGEGHHFGEWWGQGIQRNYGLKEKRFSLFNVTRWDTERPACCHVVPTLYRGMFSEMAVKQALLKLLGEGSQAAPYHDAEGIITYHVAAGVGFKTTLKDDEMSKTEALLNNK